MEDRTHDAVSNRTASPTHTNELFRPHVSIKIVLSSEFACPCLGLAMLLSLCEFDSVTDSGRSVSLPSLPRLFPSPPLSPCRRLVGLVVKASASRAEIPGSNPACAGFFSGVESYQRLKNWHSSGYPARRLALEGQCWDWLARCQYTVTGWDRKLDLQFLSQCGSTVWADPSLRYTGMLLGR